MRIVVHPYQKEKIQSMQNEKGGHPPAYPQHNCGKLNSIFSFPLFFFFFLHFLWVTNLLPFTELLSSFGLFLAQQFQLFDLTPQLDVGGLQSRVARYIQFGTALQTLPTRTHTCRKITVDIESNTSRVAHTASFGAARARGGGDRPNKNGRNQRKSNEKRNNPLDADHSFGPRKSAAKLTASVFRPESNERRGRGPCDG